MKNLLDTKTASLQEILGNGKIYTIPTFQRDYSWQSEHWEDLWNDLLAVEETGQPHYMGTVVLKNTNHDDHFIIIDGQQRFTTMTLFAVATIAALDTLAQKNIEKSQNQERIQEIERTYIGKKTISTLHYETKLKLNKNNDLFFQDILLLRKEPIAYAKLKDSEKRLYDGYTYFYQQIIQKFGENGLEIAQFLEDLAGKKMIFIQITVDDELDAYTVFETLNARGVELTTTDLLKNYLFALCASQKSESEMDILGEKWHKIVNNIGFDEFPKFLRYFLNSQYKLVRKENLFKNIKQKVRSAADVFQLLTELEKKEVLYTAIRNPDDDFWYNHPQKISIIRSLRELRLFQVSQPIPLLFIIFEKLPDLFHLILKDLVNISFRYNIIAQKNPNDLEVVYNTIAQKIYQNEYMQKEQIHAELQKIYVADEDFKQFFSSREITTGGRNKKIVKYIVTKIENHIQSTDNDWNDANFTIEHILPENFSADWNEIFNNNASKFVYRLGNYTLLEDSLNRKCSDKKYEYKKEIYKTSRYKLTNEYILKDEWDMRAINEYQQKLAKIAKDVWKM